MPQVQRWPRPRLRLSFLNPKAKAKKTKRFDSTMVPGRMTGWFVLGKTTRKVRGRSWGWKSR